jgi:hypothetical protein
MIVGDNGTCYEFFAGINDTVEQLSPVTTTPAKTFFPGVVDTGQKMHKALNLSPVSMTSPKNCSAVSTTPRINFSTVSTKPPIRLC